MLMCANISSPVVSMVSLPVRNLRERRDGFKVSRLMSTKVEAQPRTPRLRSLVNTETESKMWLVNGILEPDTTWIALMEKKTTPGQEPRFGEDSNDRTSEVKHGKSQ